MLASMYGQRELVKLLLKHGAKVDIEDDVRVNNTPRLEEGLIDSLQGKERACRQCVVMCAYVTVCTLCGCVLCNMLSQHILVHETTQFFPSG